MGYLREDSAGSEFGNKKGALGFSDRFSGPARGLGEDFVEDAGWFDTSEALIEALESVGEAFVIDADEMEGGGVEVANLDGMIDGVVAKVVGATEGDP